MRDDEFVVSRVDVSTDSKTQPCRASAFCSHLSASPLARPLPHCRRMESVERLKYLDAHHIETPAGRLDGAVFVSPTNAQLGKLDGVLIDPGQRRVRYYIVETRGRFSSRHYLLPLTATRLDSDRRTLEVDIEAEEIERLDKVEPDTLPRFSDDDLIAALFHSGAS